jgi:ABC-type uncharacterized transport system substrate-binding protein
MTIKILIWLLATFFLRTGPVAQAQPATKIPRIGYVRQGTPASAKAEDEAFREGMRDRGYVEGKNILIEYRYGEGNLDRVPELVAELIGLKVELIVVGGNRATRAAKQATSTIPIVVGSADDLVRAGLVASLANPGGNITGSTGIAPDLSGKRLEILKEVLPQASRLAVVWYPSKDAADEAEVKETETAARQFRVKLQFLKLREPSQFQNVFTEITKQRANAVIIIQDAFTLTHRVALVELATKRRLPTMCEQLAWTIDGCLMSYGRDQLAQWRRAAVFVDKILKGTKPADIPVEQPMKFELVFNLKTANQIGVTIPQWPLMKADKVIR